ncbi:hypothetical protein, partial [Xanthomonas perforans]
LGTGPCATPTGLFGNNNTTILITKQLIAARFRLAVGAVRRNPVGGGGRRRAGTVRSRQKTAPTAWRHILLNGHYTFQRSGKIIDLDALVAGLELG